MCPGQGRPVRDRLRVFIVEDHRQTREGLDDSLEQEGFEVVGRCPVADATVEGIAAAGTDVCVLGLGTSGTGAIDVCRAVAGQGTGVPCVVLALRHRPAEAEAAFRAGAAAYVLARLPLAALAFTLTRAAGASGRP
jgi:DNA-binding NarL/FixJ family response regulator